MMIACKLLIEAKTGWKTSIRKQLTAFDRASWRSPAQINHCALRYPGWKTVDLVSEQTSLESAMEFARSLASIGAGCVYFHAEEGCSETGVTCYFDGEFRTYPSAQAAESAYFDAALDRNMCFFGPDYPGDDKLLVRIRPRNKSTHAAITSLLLAYLNDRSDENFERIAAYFNPELNAYSRTEDMNVEWRFPGYCSGGCPDGFVVDDRLARNLIYFYDNGSHLHLGFQHPDLGRFASGDFNYHGGQEGDGMLAILDCLAYLSTSIAAKARLRRFGSAAVEGYFFGSKESLYYREQVQIPEPIWGEAVGADEAGRSAA